MRKTVLVLLLIALSCPAIAQEVFFSAGVTRDTNTRNTRNQWSVTYKQNLGDHAAFSFSYLNEGHQINHYRDGLAAQLWGRTGLLDSRLSLALGIGPFAYADTHVAPITETFQDRHGFGLISSATATWYGMRPLLLQARVNYIGTGQSFDTVSGTFGIGYLLGAPVPPETSPQPVAGKRTTNNEITLFLGQAVLNSAKSEKDTALSVEYRRRLMRYLDWTIAWLSEGNTHPFGRNGILTQLWAVRPFYDDDLALGIGAGPYIAHDKYSGDNEGKEKAAGAVSFTVSYRFHPQFALRGSFTRIVTNYDRDTDVFLGGLTYRF